MADEIAAVLHERRPYGGCSTAIGWTQCPLADAHRRDAGVAAEGAWEVATGPDGGLVEEAAMSNALAALDGCRDEVWRLQRLLEAVGEATDEGLACGACGHVVTGDGGTEGEEGDRLPADPADVPVSSQGDR